MSKLTGPDEKTIAKLDAILQKEDLVLKPSTRLRSEIVMADGSTRPLKLRNYQVQMILHLIAMRRFIVGDDCGLGKTLMTIASCCYLWDRGEAEKVVVLTKKSVVNQWCDEVHRFTTGVATFPAKGTPKQRAKAYAAFKDHVGPAVLVMGYRSAVQDFEEMQGWKIGVFVLDEVTMVKNSSSQVHRVVRYLASDEVSDRVWGLTATLIKNNLMEGYGIYRVVVPGLFHPTETAFMNDFCIVQMQPIGKGRKVPVVVGYRRADVERFKQIIRPYYLGRAKHTVAKELPVLTTKVVHVGMSGAQHLKYAEALAGLLLVGEDEKEVTKLTAVTYCQEIVNHPALIQCDGESEKLDALVEMVTEGDLEGEKVIVYTRFERMVKLGIDALTAAGVKCIRVTGAETIDQRAEAQRLFQDMNSDVKVIWITNAGGDAINLQSARALVFFDTPFSAGDYLQVVGRMIRIGSTHDRVFALHLVAKGTIDERVLAIRERKMGLLEAVIGKRILGDESSDEILTNDNDVNALFDALREDAKGLIRG
jgi:SNF2 family DNA or RNA helicase